MPQHLKEVERATSNRLHAFDRLFAGKTYTCLAIPAATDHPVSSLQKMMDKIRPVLTGNAGDQSSLTHRRSFFSIIGVVGPLASW